MTQPVPLKYGSAPDSQSSPTESPDNTGEFGHPPWWLWPILIPAAGLYRMVIAGRIGLFRLGLIRMHRASIPIISIGNLTVGGTGKTPATSYLIDTALQAGRHPVILSRGYGRRSRARLARVLSHPAPDDAQLGSEPGDVPDIDPRRVGDEPAMLAKRHPGVPIYVGAHRRESARLAPLWDGADLLVLDDGYQHLRLHRDLNVLLIDAERGFGNGRVLPMGPLREPLSALARADVIVVSKANLGDSEALIGSLTRLVQPGTPIFRADFVPTRVVRLDGGAVLPPDALSGRKAVLLCAIAHPEGFARVATGLGVVVAGMHAQPDHDPFNSAELATLEARIEAEIAAETGTGTTPGVPAQSSEQVPMVLVTEKDAIKLRHRVTHPENYWVLEMGMDPEPDAKAFFFDFIRGGELPSS